MMEKELPVWLRRPLLGLYVRAFNCDMEEAVEEELVRYQSFSDLFTRQLKAGTRPVSSDHSLVSHPHACQIVIIIILCRCAQLMVKCYILVESISLAAWSKLRGFPTICFNL